MDAEQRLALEHAIEAVTQERVQRSEAEGSERQTFDVVNPECLLELGRLCAVRGPSNQQQAHPTRLEPAERERERAHRRCIEPLQVVDRNNRRPLSCKRLQDVPDRDCERAWIDGFRRGLL